MRRRFERVRRRQPVATWGFLRPSQRTYEDEQRSRQRLRENPHRLREYRSSLALQLGVTGVLVLSCIVLMIQMIVMLRRFEEAFGIPNRGWIIPVLIAALGAAALRRFLRVLAEYRKLRNS